MAGKTAIAAPTDNQQYLGRRPWHEVAAAIRSDMHPADQYEAFAKLHGEEGKSAEDIAARFGVSAAVVRQRLKLGAVSPKLRSLYRKGDMNLDQLSASGHAPGIDESVAEKQTAERHTEWAKRLPAESGGLWNSIHGLADAERLDLLAHCVSLTANAIRARGRRADESEAHAAILAQEVALDMTPIGSRPPRITSGRSARSASFRHSARACPSKTRRKSRA